MSSELLNRRNFLKKAALVVGGSLIASPLLLASPILNLDKKEEEEVSPNEDLMREHGILRRIILIYREAIHRMNEKQELNPALINKSATIIRHFIEEYHEKLEENFLFPRFEKKGRLVDLVSTLKIQHQAGRKLTDYILEASSSKHFKSHNKNFIEVLYQFINMYESHAAREDTVLFPAFKAIVSDSEYQEMGEQFEEEEHKRFGKDGFDGMVSQVEAIEKELHIYDLAKFTPQSIFGEKI
ncbi:MULTISPECIES: hemerythrin domain-containing protein [Legionella]|uniref:Hemerythrin domain-containing protein n=1 Tax=Legionella lytica TaxID=96232 RepID=A0ABY4YA21_9GAMM|nr:MULTISPECIES: hemerythrin domain-containing protein [Legionella]RUR13480.1 hemerythrin domain-containing protein [Legionella septentrionalis]USQ14503.1 hemerythrin domain-containing protein [Legionella lytica]